MDLSGLVEVALGLVLIYVSLSLACSQIQEIISRLLNLRARNLEEALLGMITQPETAPGVLNRLRMWIPRTIAQVRNWYASTFRGGLPDIPSEGKLFIAELYTHPLLKALIRPGSTVGPEYVPTAAFSQALFNTLMKAGNTVSAVQHSLQQTQRELLADPRLDAGARAQLTKALQSDFGPLLQKIGALPQNVTPQTLSALGEELNTLSVNYPALKQALTLAQLRQGIESQKNRFPDLYRGLNTLLHETEVDLKAGESAFNTTRAKVESWYDNTMDRATVWYKQRIQWGLFAVGFGTALLLNVDTLTIGSTLWREPTLRQAVAEHAKSIAAQPAVGTTGTTETPTAIANRLSAELAALNIPVGWKLTPVSLREGQACSPFAQVPLLQRANDVTGLPFGGCQAIAEFPPDLPSGGIKLLGLLISGLAAMQGAPFWFDILQKIVNVGQSTRKEQKEKA